MFRGYNDTTNFKLQREELQRTARLNDDFDKNYKTRFWKNGIRSTDNISEFY